MQAPRRHVAGTPQACQGGRHPAVRACLRDACLTRGGAHATSSQFHFSVPALPCMSYEDPGWDTSWPWAWAAAAGDFARASERVASCGDGDASRFGRRSNLLLAALLLVHLHLATLLLFAVGWFLPPRPDPLVALLGLSFNLLRHMHLRGCAWACGRARRRRARARTTASFAIYIDVDSAHVATLTLRVTAHPHSLART